jgi:hypothetical protein
MVSLVQVKVNHQVKRMTNQMSLLPTKNQPKVMTVMMVKMMVTETY